MRSTRRRRRCSTLLLGLLAGTSWPTAHPRTQEPGPPAEGAPPAEAAVELAPVTVTGEKVARPLEETTSSVTVVPRAALPPLQNRDIFDALRFVPNVVDTSGGGQPTIRGVDASGGPGFGGGAAFSGSRPRATVFVDGVPQLSSISRTLEPGAFDLEQVEFFRGPQSTIQGRNSLAGAVVARTRDPTFEPEAILEGGYLNEGPTWFGGAAVSGPLVKDQLAARLAVDAQEGRAFDKLAFPGLNPSRWSNDDARNARLKLLLLPEALPAASAKLTLAHQIDQEISSPGQVNGRDLVRGKDRTDEFAINRGRASSAALELGYELATGLRLELLPSYVDGRLNLDTPDGLLEFEETSDQWSGEARLVFDPPGDDRVQGVAGLYGFRRTLEQKNPTEDLGFAADDELSTLAAFGEATALVWGPFGVVLGGRVERERQDREFDARFGAPLDFSVSKDAEVFLPKAGLVYRPGPAFSAALTAQRGYNAGGGSVSFLTATPYEFDTETSWTYELALRSTLLGNRLALAGNVFYSTYDDYQTFAAGPEGPNDTVTVNVPEARAYGAELEARARPLPPLEVFAGLGLLETEFTDFEDSAQDFGGNQFIAAPSYTLTLGAAVDLPNGVRLSADARWVDDYYGDLENTGGGETRDYVVVNARAEVAWSGATVFAFANNLLDEDYQLARDRDPEFRFAVIGPPRALGAGLRVEF